MIVLKDGKPVLASVATGAPLQEITLQNLLDILDFGMDPKTAIDQPGPRGPFYGMAQTQPDLGAETVAQGDFPESALNAVRARGQAIKLLPQYVQSGSWVGIQIDANTHKLKGAGSRYSPTTVEAF